MYFKLSIYSDDEQLINKLAEKFHLVRQSEVPFQLLAKEFDVTVETIEFYTEINTISDVKQNPMEDLNYFEIEAYCDNEPEPDVWADIIDAINPELYAEYQFCNDVNINRTEFFRYSEPRGLHGIKI